eukprot:m.111251 g.111251  ORF g.111251 m.111251 type:complete len:105 (+) comp15286_c1_seq1:273-587(+)
MSVKIRQLWRARRRRLQWKGRGRDNCCFDPCCYVSINCLVWLEQDERVYGVLDGSVWLLLVEIFSFFFFLVLLLVLLVLVAPPLFRLCAFLEIADVVIANYVRS